MISIIKKALTTLTRSNAIGQCSYMGSTTNYESVHPYGYYALPEAGSLVILQSIMGDESNKVGTEYDNTKIDSILGELSAGDNAVYNPTSNSYMIFRKSGDIEIKASGSANLKIEATSEHTGDMTIIGNVTVTGNITATGNVAALNVTATGTLSGGGKDMNVHAHTAGSYTDSLAAPVTGNSGGIV